MLDVSKLHPMSTFTSMSVYTLSYKIYHICILVIYSFMLDVGCEYLQPGVVEGLVDCDPLCGVQHQHAAHQVFGALWDVAPLPRVHLRTHTQAHAQSYARTHTHTGAEKQKTTPHFEKGKWQRTLGSDQAMSWGSVWECVCVCVCVCFKWPPLSHPLRLSLLRPLALSATVSSLYLGDFCPWYFLFKKRKMSPNGEE